MTRTDTGGNLRPADEYRAIYVTRWRVNQRHDRRSPRSLPANDNAGVR
jgi:hypothetical protein